MHAWWLTILNLEIIILYTTQPGYLIVNVKGQYNNSHLKVTFSLAVDKTFPDDAPIVTGRLSHEKK